MLGCDRSKFSHSDCEVTFTMTTEAKASTRYGDLKGTISIDGFEHLMFHTFPGAAKGYQPVGLEISYSVREKGDTPSIQISLLAVDRDTLKGSGPNAVFKQAKESGELKVFRFRTKLTLDRLLPHIKRMEIVLNDESSSDMPLMIQEYNATDEEED